MPIISEEDERAGRRIVSGQETVSGVPERTYEDHVDTNTNNRAQEGRVMYNGQEMTLVERKTAPTGSGARALRTISRGNKRRFCGSEPRNTRLHGRAHDGTNVVLKE